MISLMKRTTWLTRGILLRTLLTISLLIPTLPSAAVDDFETLKTSFQNLPDDTRPGCYWYWINDNISTAGITKDLEAMAEVGIGRAYIGHIYDRRSETDTPPGNVKFMSDHWWEAVQWAVKEADRFGIEIGFFNSPGWSQSGASWIKPHQSMRYLGHSEVYVTGGTRIDTILPVPEITTFPHYGGSNSIRTGPNFSVADFQDVRVVAFRQPDNLMRGKIRPLAIRSDIAGYEALFDDSELTSVTFAANTTASLTLQLPKETLSTAPVQTIHIDPADDSFTLHCTWEASEDGSVYWPINTYTEQRGHQGPKKDAPVAVPVGVFSAPYMRLNLRFNKRSPERPVRIREISFTNEPHVASYARKQLAETSPHTIIPVDAYSWTTQPAPTTGTAVASADVVDLSEKMDANGRLLWDAPPGQWTILRMGMIPIGTQCAPCSPEARGLEIDKMNREHASAIFEGMVGEFLRRTAPGDRKALKYIIADSYETGPQNWTDNFIEKFEQRFGYNPTRFLTVMTGRVVDTPEVSDRFLWDLRQLIVESVAYEYVGGLRDIAHDHGLKLWLENYGHWGFISEFLLYGSQTDEVGGEIWESSNPANNVECRAAASSAHIYGKCDVFAEMFTSARNFKQSLASMKLWCDWAFGSGINRAILHVYIHQPDERKPGIIEWFGTAFNRHNTWFKQSKAFNDYIRRGAVLLRAGRPVADVAYYIGEHSPSMTGPMEPELPPGYDFDHINSDVLINGARVVDGRIVTNGGTSYAVLVLPPHEEMRPEVAEALDRLVRDGATVIGPKPKRSPSLQGYPECDNRLQQIADTIWGPVDGEQVKLRRHGKGIICSGIPLDQLLTSVVAREGIMPTPPALELPNSANLVVGVAGTGTIGVEENGGLIFKHRQTADSDIYFIANTSAKATDTSAYFRVSGRQPHLLNAVSGDVVEAAAFSSQNGRTIVPLHLEPSESIFVVFAGATKSAAGRASSNEPNFRTIAELNNNWTVRFDGFGAPESTVFPTLSDWSAHTDPAIRHYSGTATYDTSFTLASLPVDKIVLDLGNVAIVATVTINGHEVGTLWTNPWVIDITKHLREGENRLEVRVTNSWNNRLVGDAGKPAEERQSHVSRHYNFARENPLLPSGLLGPVTIKSRE